MFDSKFYFDFYLKILFLSCQPTYRVSGLELSRTESIAPSPSDHPWELVRLKLLFFAYKRIMIDIRGMGCFVLGHMDHVHNFVYAHFAF